MEGKVEITGGSASVKFTFDDGYVMVYPKGAIIAISDVSDMISFKLTGSRKTICSVLFSDITPSESTAAETVEALNSIL